LAVSQIASVTYRRTDGRQTTDDNDAKTPYSIVVARQKQQNPVLNFKIV